jgi:hypothetical protein
VIAFFEASWIFWWLLAIIAILRWFHLFTATSASEPDTSFMSNLNGHNHSKLKLRQRSALQSS